MSVLDSTHSRCSVFPGRGCGFPEETADGWTTWYRDAPDQQASYLTTESVGDFELREAYSSASDVPIIERSTRS